MKLFMVRVEFFVFCFFKYVVKRKTTSNELQKTNVRRIFSTRWRRKEKGDRGKGNAARVISGFGPTCH